MRIREFRTLNDKREQSPPATTCIMGSRHPLGLSDGINSHGNVCGDAGNVGSNNNATTNAAPQKQTSPFTELSYAGICRLLSVTAKKSP